MNKFIALMFITSLSLGLITLALLLKFVPQLSFLFCLGLVVLVTTGMYFFMAFISECFKTLAEELKK